MPRSHSQNSYPSRNAGTLIRNRPAVPDISGYVKIKQLSAGSGHPGNVAATGRTAYLKPGNGAADGIGHFSAPRRGGPAS